MYNASSISFPSTITTAIATIALIVLPGCTTDDFLKDRPVSRGKTSKHVATWPDAQNNKWVGKTTDELISERGKPSITLGTAQLTGMPSSDTAYVYPSTTGCADTYVIENGSNRVVKYFCR